MNAWIAVERKLERGLRDQIVKLLAEWRAYIEEHGERPDLSTTTLDERPPRYERHHRDLPDADVTLVIRDGERVPFEQRPTIASPRRTLDSDAVLNPLSGERVLAILERGPIEDLPQSDLIRVTVYKAHGKLVNYRYTSL